MENNKGQTIFLSVIGIATLLVAIVGATFAWFSTQLDSTRPADAAITTATIKGVTLTGTAIAGVDNVLPGWESAEGTLVVATTDLTGAATIPYECNVYTSNTLGGELQYHITGPDDSVYGAWTDITATTAATAQVITPASTTLEVADQSDTWKVQIRFRETGEDQNTQQTQSATATFNCKLTGEGVYYTDGIPEGTTDENTITPD